MKTMSKLLESFDDRMKRDPNNIEKDPAFWVIVAVIYGSIITVVFPTVYFIIWKFLTIIV